MGTAGKNEKVWPPRRCGCVSLSVSMSVLSIVLSQELCSQPQVFLLHLLNSKLKTLKVDIIVIDTYITINENKLAKQVAKEVSERNHGFCSYRFSSPVIGSIY